VDFSGLRSSGFRDSRSGEVKLHVVATLKIAKSEKAEISGEKGPAFSILGFRG
jgi:hypothetical protein